MYGVNASVPKTLVRHLVAYCAAESTPALREVLEDILATPVSPELLPPENGNISQKTEDLVRPLRAARLFPVPLPARRLSAGKAAGSSGAGI